MRPRGAQGIYRTNRVNYESCRETEACDAEQAYDRDQITVTQSLANRWAVPLVTHHVNDNACDGDIEPDGSRPLGQALVFVKTLPKCGNHRHDDHGQIHNGQENMRNQQGVVEGLDRAFSGELHMKDVEVIIQVTAQKHGGESQRRDHAGDVGFLIAHFDKDQT